MTFVSPPKLICFFFFKDHPSSAAVALDSFVVTGLPSEYKRESSVINLGDPPPGPLPEGTQIAMMPFAFLLCWEVDPPRLTKIRIFDLYLRPSPCSDKDLTTHPRTLKLAWYDALLDT